MKFFIFICFAILIIFDTAYGRSLEIFIDPKIPLRADGGLKEKQLALTFDDGPSPATTLKILSILKKHEVKATFFQVGTFAKSHPEITKKIFKDGHSLGSHSWDHQNLASLSTAEALKNIKRGHEAIEDAVGDGFKTLFFRYPYLTTTTQLQESIAKWKFIPFDSNIIIEDWMIFDAKALLAKALKKVKVEKKGIVLFHDNHPKTAEMLDAFLSELISDGYLTIVFRAQSLK